MFVKNNDNNENIDIKSYEFISYPNIIRINFDNNDTISLQSLRGFEIYI